MAEFLQVVLGGVAPRLEYDGGVDLFAVLGVGCGECQGVLDGRVGEQHCFDGLRGDLFAAAVDHLLRPPGEEQVSVGVEMAQITGAEPTVGERGGGSFRVVEVAACERRTVDADLAGLAGGRRAATRRDDTHPQLGGKSYGRFFAGAVLWERVRRGLMRSLCHAVRGYHWRAEVLVRSVQDGRRKRRAAAADEAELGRLVGRVVAGGAG